MKAQRAETTDATQELSAVYDYGFDRSTYPGDTEMQGLWTNTSLAFTGFYLAPAPDHSDTSWMGKRAKLKSMGWGLRRSPGRLERSHVRARSGRW